MNLFNSRYMTAPSEVQGIVGHALLRWLQMMGVASSYPRCHDMEADGMGVSLCRDSAEPRLEGSDPGEGGGVTIVTLSHSYTTLLLLHAGHPHSHTVCSSLPRPLDYNAGWVPLCSKQRAL